MPRIGKLNFSCYRVITMGYDLLIIWEYSRNFDYSLVWIVVSLITAITRICWKWIWICLHLAKRWAHLLSWYILWLTSSHNCCNCFSMISHSIVLYRKHLVRVGVWVRAGVGVLVKSRHCPYSLAEWTSNCLSVIHKITLCNNRMTIAIILICSYQAVHSAFQVIAAFSHYVYPRTIDISDQVIC